MRILGNATAVAARVTRATSDVPDPAPIERHFVTGL
jgi:hypothetical protein